MNWAVTFKVIHSIKGWRIHFQNRSPGVDLKRPSEACGVGLTTPGVCVGGGFLPATAEAYLFTVGAEMIFLFYLFK